MYQANQKNIDLMEYRSLEITILSADDLKNVNFFGKMNSYVVVSVLDWAEDPDYYRTKKVPKQKTPIDKEGHKNPTWNHLIKFVVSEVAIRHNRLSLLFQIRSRRTFPSDKLIGEVYIPLNKLLSSSETDPTKATIVSYQVSKPSGKAKGVLNFSYRFPENAPEGGFPMNMWIGEAGGKAEYVDQQVSGYPAAAPLAYGMSAGMLYGYPIPPGYGYPLSPTNYGAAYSMQHDYGCGYGYGYPPPVLPALQETEKDNNKDKDNDNDKDTDKGELMRETDINLGNMGRGMIVGLVAGGALAGILMGKLVSNMAFDGVYFGLF